MGVRVHMTKESKLLRKCKRKKVGCVGWGSGVDMNKELKLLLKLQKKKWRGSGPGVGGQSGWE